MKRLTVFICSVMLLASPSIMAKPDNDKPLPPGLAKKVSQGKPLPPGWQKKLAPGQFLADEYYSRGVILDKADSRGIIRIQVEGTLIELFEHSREIVRILDKY